MRTGDAFWVNDVPPLDGGLPKRRPVVVLILNDLPPPADASCEVVVAATTDDELDLGIDEDAVRIEDDLPVPCWVIPRWVLEVHRMRLREPAGRVSDPLLERLISAVVDRHWSSGGLSE